MKSILVTGGNQGIGYALCKQLAVDHGCRVFLTARNPARGRAATEKIASLIQSTPSCQGAVEYIPLDTSDEDSIRKAAALTKEALAGSDPPSLYGIVNNAGIGLNTGGDVVATNLYGPKRVNDHFLELLQPKGARIVNLGSGSGPMYVGSVRNKKDRRMLCGGAELPEVTWEWIADHARKNVNGSDVYGLSKALVSCYTGLFAREHPQILSSAVTPGFIDTQMTAGWGASKSPDEGTLAIKKCLFEELEGNGWYYGSDGVRSPYHFMRSPGEPEYDGVNPFL